MVWWIHITHYLFSRLAYSFSDEHKRKLGLAHSGAKNYWYGTDGAWKGKQHSEETKSKMSKAKDENKVSVVCINKESHEVIQTYSSLTMAHKDTGTDKSSIRQCCQGKSKTAGGYIWRFV